MTLRKDSRHDSVWTAEHQVGQITHVSLYTGSLLFSTHSPALTTYRLESRHTYTHSIIRMNMNIHERCQFRVIREGYQGYRDYLICFLGGYVHSIKIS